MQPEDNIKKQTKKNKVSSMYHSRKTRKGSPIAFLQCPPLKQMRRTTLKKLSPLSVPLGTKFRRGGEYPLAGGQTARHPEHTQLIKLGLPGEGTWILQPTDFYVFLPRKVNVPVIGHFRRGVNCHFRRPLGCLAGTRGSKSATGLAGRIALVRVRVYLSRNLRISTCGQPLHALIPPAPSAVFFVLHLSSRDQDVHVGAVEASTDRSGLCSGREKGSELQASLR